MDISKLEETTKKIEDATKKIRSLIPELSLLSASPMQLFNGGEELMMTLDRADFRTVSRHFLKRRRFAKRWVCQDGDIGFRYVLDGEVGLVMFLRDAA